MALYNHQSQFLSVLISSYQNYYANQGVKEVPERKQYTDLSLMITTNGNLSINKSKVFFD